MNPSTCSLILVYLSQTFMIFVWQSRYLHTQNGNNQVFHLLVNKNKNKNNNNNNDNNDSNNNNNKKKKTK